MSFVPHPSPVLLALALLLFPILPTIPAQKHALPQSNDPLMSQIFEQWIAKHGRHYKSAAEKASRFQIFKTNVEYIKAFNRNGTRKFKLGVNQFADLTNSEMNAMINNAAAPAPTDAMRRRGNSRGNASNIPQSIDWRAKGAVTPVKDQGSCGACWVFAALATVESATQIKTGRLVSLSEQQVLDCTDGNGCTGGTAETAYSYIIRNGGIASEDNYPYVERDNEVCDTTVAANIAANITSYRWVPSNNEMALMQAVAKQPVYVSIDAGSNEFAYFSGDGIFDGSCGTLRHAVAIIGYGADADGSKYWLVKNSWGTSWGNGGFGKMARGIGGAEGICGILGEPVFPIV